MDRGAALKRVGKMGVGQHAARHNDVVRQKALQRRHGAVKRGDRLFVLTARKEFVRLLFQQFDERVDIGRFVEGKEPLFRLNRHFKRGVGFLHVAQTAVRAAEPETHVDVFGEKAFPARKTVERLEREHEFLDRAVRVANRHIGVPHRDGNESDRRFRLADSPVDKSGELRARLAKRPQGRGFRAGREKAQHPGWEMSQQGIHAQRGVSCADCHMPYKQD
ncbi:MAG: ammonia-forming cytochrome c nitrite reductase subunit c552, partial [Thermoguttaceae bacterium]|nr:ammonia-forming cytochrome c nitrite reductase subunit c552 [Thermoguttaceae bacterium]